MERQSAEGQSARPAVPNYGGRAHPHRTTRTSPQRTDMIGDLFDSPWKILIVAGVIIVLFGSAKLPMAARSLGKSMRILKAEVKDFHEDEAEPKPVAAAPAVAQPHRTSMQPQLTADQAQLQIDELQRQLAELKQTSAEPVRPTR